APVLKRLELLVAVRALYAEIEDDEHRLSVFLILIEVDDLFFRIVKTELLYIGSRARRPNERAEIGERRMLAASGERLSLVVPLRGGDALREKRGVMHGGFSFSRAEENLRGRRERRRLILVLAHRLFDERYRAI